MTVNYSCIGKPQCGKEVGISLSVISVIVVFGANQLFEMLFHGANCRVNSHLIVV